jgi:chromosome segregation ATPase
MQSRLQAAQIRLQNLRTKPVMNSNANELNNLLVQENTKKSNLQGQIGVKQNQIATAKVNLANKQNTVNSLKTKITEQHSKVAKVDSLLSDFQDFSIPSANTQSDDFAELMGKLNSLNFEG